MATDARGDNLLGPLPFTRAEFDLQVDAAMRIIDDQTAAMLDRLGMSKLDALRLPKPGALPPLEDGCQPSCVCWSETSPDIACATCCRNPALSDNYEEKKDEN